MKNWMILTAGLLVISAGTPMAQEEAYTAEFDVEDCSFSDRKGNDYFSLTPGDKLVLAGEDEGELLEVEITVLRDREWITFETTDGERVTVRTRVIEEREWVDGELAEVSRNFFARCRETGDIFYFGEDVDIYEDGVIVSSDGAWRAGMDGAQPGIIMPGRYLVGSRYFQEIAAGVALDRAENVAMGLEIEVEAGLFDECIEILETTPLDPEEESVKVYCDDVGLVIDDDIELVDFELKDEDDERDGEEILNQLRQLFGRR